MEGKKVADSVTEQIRVVIYPDINGFGRLFGGQLLKWVDEVAGATARRHCGHNATTAAIDNLQFKAGAFLNDVLVLLERGVAVDVWLACAEHVQVWSVDDCYFHRSFEF